MKFGVSTLGYIQVLDADNGNDVDDLVQENHLQYLPSPSSPYTLGNQISSFAWLNIKVVQTWIERYQIFPLILTKEFQMTKLLNNWKWKERENMAKGKLNFVIRKKNVFFMYRFLAIWMNTWPFLFLKIYVQALDLAVMNQYCMDPNFPGLPQRPSSTIIVLLKNQR